MDRAGRRVAQTCGRASSSSTLSARESTLCLRADAAIDGDQQRRIDTRDALEESIGSRTDDTAAPPERYPDRTEGDEGRGGATTTDGDRGPRNLHDDLWNGRWNGRWGRHRGRPSGRKSTRRDQRSIRGRVHVKARRDTERSTACHHADVAVHRVRDLNVEHRDVDPLITGENVGVAGTGPLLAVDHRSKTRRHRRNPVPTRLAKANGQRIVGEDLSRTERDLGMEVRTLLGGVEFAPNVLVIRVRDRWKEQQHEPWPHRRRTHEPGQSIPRRCKSDRTRAASVEVSGSEPVVPQVRTLPRGCSQRIAFHSPAHVTLERITP